MRVLLSRDAKVQEERGKLLADCAKALGIASVILAVLRPIVEGGPFSMAAIGLAFGFWAMSYIFYAMIAFMRPAQDDNT